MAGSSGSGAGRHSPVPVIAPHSEVPDGTGLTIEVRVELDGSYEPARKAFAKHVQEYAERLAAESARQEISERALGARTCEITESAVLRAAESLERATAKRQRPENWLEASTLIGLPVFSAATPIMGGYLHSKLQWYALIGLSALMLFCILYQGKRRLL